MQIVWEIASRRSVTRINNDTYSFYKQHYKECMEGYVKNNADADNSSALFTIIFF